MSQPVVLDDTDRRILELLEQNARRTVSDIATHVNLSAAPVKRRIDRLERLGVIRGYTVVLDHARIGPTIEAFSELRINGDKPIDEIVATVTRMPEVHEAFATAGDTDVLIRIRVDDAEHLKDVVNGLRRTGQVTGTRTLLVLERWKSAPEEG